ncbi:MAG: ribosome maturation factor RimM [Oceanospirillales bacterium LUC14_002_19_P2]|nr:MAG: ribosome maturation factor RimM [Oceanospirillales bacterium LUC14_002_19_P2]
MSVAGAAVRPSGQSFGAEQGVTMGRITSVYGVKGWVKVYSFADPMENILKYRQWLLRYPDGRTQAVTIDGGRKHGKGIVAHVAGCDDRDRALQFAGTDILISRDELPELEAGDYYWHQLEGLTVLALTESGDEVNLGKVDHLIETGSNDVLVLRAAKGSIDKRERMVPYLLDQVVQEINLEEGFMRVLWDPDF